MADETYEANHTALMAAAAQFQAVGKHVAECLRKIDNLRRQGDNSQFAGEIQSLIAFAENLQQVTGASLYSRVSVVPQAPPEPELSAEEQAVLAQSSSSSRKAAKG